MTSIGEGVLIGLALWGGLAATLSAWPAIFAKWPWRLWLINNGCFVLSGIVMSIILSAWD